MKNSLLLLICVILHCLETPMAAQEPRFVLMKSGNLIEGQPSEFEDQTKIEFSNQDYIFVATEKIEKTFLNRRDVFNYRAAITPLDAASQNRFLQWVIRQRNYEFAKKHLMELSATEVDLDFDNWSQIISKRLDLSAVRQPVVRSKSIHPETEFSRNAERHLVLGCGLAGCHSVNDSQSFQLVDSANQRKTASPNANFKNAIETISKLGRKEFLAYVSTKHGRLRRGMYPTATVEYLAIATWVNGSVKTNSNPKQITAPVPAIQNRPKSIPQITKSAVSQTEPSDYKISSQAKNLDAGLAAEFRPRDEFDPEIFNRLQEKKWGQAKSPESRHSFNGQVPGRLISPASTASRK